LKTTVSPLTEPSAPSAPRRDCIASANSLHQTKVRRSFARHSTPLLERCVVCFMEEPLPIKVKLTKAQEFVIQGKIMKSIPGEAKAF
jgi:hypothetical protein